MTLTDWLVKIEALRPEIIKLGLERIAAVAQRLNVCRLPGKVITVAGTNGKGSTVALLDALAQATGLTTSVYTSPHLFRFNERIRQQGKEVVDADLCAAFDAVEAARGAVALTYFEFTTLAALWLFCRYPTDIYLLEVGLGGRLDAVNLVDADVAVVTSIGLDHTDWLGASRAAIGREKAGIARAGKVLLYGEHDMPMSIADVCHEQGAMLKRAPASFGFESSSRTLCWQQHRLPLAEPVELGEDNLATALQALAEVGVLPSAHDIQQVAANARLKGRCERHHLHGCDWIFDVGHNREAMTRVAGRLGAHGGRTLALCAMLADKPATAALALAPLVDQWFVADLPGVRGGGVERFATVLPQAQRFHQLDAALAALRASLAPGDRVLVIGSFVTVMQVQEWLGLIDVSAATSATATVTMSVNEKAI